MKGLLNNSNYMKAEITFVNSKVQLAKLAKALGVRHDWHEPDESDVSAFVTGEIFDNAGGGGELTVHITKDNKEVARVNIATLLAFASGTYDGY